LKNETEARYLVRAAKLDDSAEIARLSGELGYPAVPAEISARLQSLLNHPNHFIAVAAIDNEQSLLGWIAAEERMMLVAAPQIEIMGLVVDHAARREGIGHALIAAVERWTRERGVRYIVVRSNVRRDESHPFYEGLGYAREKSQHVYVKELTVDVTPA
jgi:GNAT superfamily N-acetyltransferase